MHCEATELQIQSEAYPLHRPVPVVECSQLMRKSLNKVLAFERQSVLPATQASSVTRLVRLLKREKKR